MRNVEVSIADYWMTCISRCLNSINGRNPKLKEKTRSLSFKHTQRMFNSSPLDLHVILGDSLLDVPIHIVLQLALRIETALVNTSAKREYITHYQLLG